MDQVQIIVCQYPIANLEVTTSAKRNGLTQATEPLHDLTKAPDSVPQTCHNQENMAQLLLCHNEKHSAFASSFV